MNDPTRETSPLSEFTGDVAVFEAAPQVPLADKSQVRHIVRLRMETKPGRDTWRITQAWGVAPDGSPVRVLMPLTELPRVKVNSALIHMFSGEKRWSKGMKIFEPGVTSKKW